MNGNILPRTHTSSWHAQAYICTGDNAFSAAAGVALNLTTWPFQCGHTV
jgi:hypothetical protein